MGYSDYKPTDYSQGGDNFKEGDYRLKIIKAETSRSRNNNNMIVVEFAIQEAKYTFRYYLVDGEYFDANATKLFDCFKIQRGNFALDQWVGKYGRGHIAKGKEKDDGKRYWELAYLIVDTPTSAQAPRPAASSAPVQQNYPPPRPAAPAPAPAPAGDEFTDDIPF
jgi:hypothetical protein